MARYIGPKSRIARRFGEAIFGEDKVLAKRPYAPGQHGVNRRKKNSEYGTQRSRRLNTPTVYWRNSSASSSQKQPVPKVLPVRS